MLNALFSRDCLEVDIDVDGKLLTFLANHFKAQDGKSSSDTHRLQQATRVAGIVKTVKDRGRLPIVLGDLNGDVTSDKTLKPIMDLINAGALADPFKGMSASDTWTHFYEPTQQTSRLDFVLPDSTLSVSLPTVLRNGVSLKCAVAGQRFPTVGYVATEASDHCPVTVTLNL